MAVNSRAVNIFRANVRAVMAQQGLTITELAEKAGTSRPGMSRILSGDDGVTITRAERIANALGVPLPALLSTVEKIAVPA